MDRNNWNVLIGIAVIFAVTLLLIFRDSFIEMGAYSSLVVQRSPKATESVNCDTTSKMVSQFGGSATSGHLFKVLKPILLCASNRICLNYELFAGWKE